MAERGLDVGRRTGAHRSRGVAHVGRGGVVRESRVRFIRIQGVTAAHIDDELYSALMLQPRIVGGSSRSASLLQGLTAL